MKPPEIKQFEVAVWPMKEACLISDNIISVLVEQVKCSEMLTGGRSAAQLYKVWCDLHVFKQMTGVSFYFGDERCVPPDYAESNYGMAIQTLFHHGVPA